MREMAPATAAADLEAPGSAMLDVQLRPELSLSDRALLHSVERVLERAAATVGTVTEPLGDTTTGQRCLVGERLRDLQARIDQIIVELAALVEGSGVAPGAFPVCAAGEVSS